MRSPYRPGASTLRPVSRQALAYALVLATLLAVGGHIRRLDRTDFESDRPTAMTATSSAADGPDADTTTTTTRAQHPLVAVIAEYDRIYAEIVGNRDVLYDPGHPAHRQMDSLLTPGSPLRPTFIVGLSDQYLRGYIQVAGASRPEVLAPGERNARLPMIHELQGRLPNAGGTASVRACIHYDYRILDSQNLGREWSQDTRQTSQVTFERIDGRWRLYTFRWLRWACNRCGPEPPGTAVISTYIGSDRPKPTDPPCDRDPAR